MLKCFKGTGVILFLTLICMLVGCSQPKTEDRAVKRLEDYAHSIDYDYKDPQKIYPFLCDKVKTQMTKDEFVKCWEKERTYPYITPLYIYDPVVTMAEDGMSGHAVYTQAARIEGMVYELDFVYENGDYYVVDWERFADGSYLDKFDKAVQSLDWYFDVDKMKK